MEREHPHHPELEKDLVLEEVLNRRAELFFVNEILTIDSSDLESPEQCKELFERLALLRQRAESVLQSRQDSGKSELEHARAYVIEAGENGRDKEKRRLRNSPLTTKARQGLFDQQEAIGKNRALNRLGAARWFEDHRDTFDRLQDVADRGLRAHELALGDRAA